MNTACVSLSGLFKGQALMGALLAALTGSAAAAQDIVLSAPEQTIVGAPVEIGVQGTTSRKDFITIVEANSAEGGYEKYQYARARKIILDAPPIPGAYEIRYLGGARPYPTLARHPLRVADTQATLTVPANVQAGARFQVDWQGPGHRRDFIAIVKAGAKEGSYRPGYRYAKAGKRLEFTAPDQPGAYEIRYLLGNRPYRTLGRARFNVSGTQASLSSVAEIMAGASLSIDWQGPDNSGDSITIVAQGAAEKSFGDYVYTTKGSPLRLSAPETPGRYELRYVTGQSHGTLARSALLVTPVQASLQAPDEAAAGSVIRIDWQGPGNAQDYVIIAPAGSDARANGPHAYVKRGPQLRITAPETPGQYEIRYLTGRRQNILATHPLSVTPRPIPGRLRVVGEQTTNTPNAGSVVVLILDASGSMLQKIDGERRIDLAKAAVERLITGVLPDAVPFSLRVFGHKQANACRTDVEIPIGPLKRSAAVRRVSRIQARNLARTPIADSLARVGQDLAGRAGRHTIILVTDGEETCGGDPAKVIESLGASGIDVRVNIVGLAIDELMLRESFQRWARLGHGAYFDARDAQGLARGLSQAVEVPWELIDADNQVLATGVVNGAAVSVPAGRYRMRILTRPEAQVRELLIEADREATVALDAP